MWRTAVELASIRPPTLCRRSTYGDARACTSCGLQQRRQLGVRLQTLVSGCNAAVLFCLNFAPSEPSCSRRPKHATQSYHTPL